MLRIALPILLCLAASLTLAACATSDPMPRVAMQPGKCGVVAHQRMTDAVANGIDAPTAGAIYNDTYADCLHWEGKAADPSAH